MPHRLPQGARGESSRGLGYSRPLLIPRCFSIKISLRCTLISSRFSHVSCILKLALCVSLEQVGQPDAVLTKAVTIYSWLERCDLTSSLLSTPKLSTRTVPYPMKSLMISSIASSPTLRFLCAFMRAVQLAFCCSGRSCSRSTSWSRVY